MNIKLKAFAKINLGLEVLYKRKDGFHEINSIIARISLCDNISIKNNVELSLNCKPPLKIDACDNLVMSAALKFRERFANDNPGAEISLKKIIPVGAGLGGGSSDAAYTLIGLGKLWKIKPDKRALLELSAELGSDVPFFLGIMPAEMRGRGEILSYFRLRLPYKVLIVYPDIHISTQWAYNNLKRGSQARQPFNFKDIIVNTIEKPEMLRKRIFNDFEPLIFEEYPEIAAIKEKLYESGSVFALMSGSGSAVFGLFNDYEGALGATKFFPEYEYYVCDFI